MMRQGIAHPQMSMAQLSEAWCVLNRVSPTQEPVKRLLATIAKQEERLSESVNDLEFRRGLYNILADRCDRRTVELAEARAQRNRLKDAMNELWHYYSLTGAAYELIEKALADLGNSPANAERMHHLPQNTMKTL
jgi:homospermidine synthase